MIFTSRESVTATAAATTTAAATAAAATITDTKCGTKSPGS